MDFNHNQIFGFLMFLLTSLTACEEEPIPVFPIPDQPENPIGEIKPSINLVLSDDLACPGQEIELSIEDLFGKEIAFSEVNFSLSPEIGILDLASGKYKAPAQINESILLELIAEFKKDTSIKSGKVIRLRPQDSGSFVLTDFSGFESTIDSGQLPDGSLVFASSNPVEPPAIAGQFDFEIFCADQKGKLLWHTNLGLGILRKIYVGHEAIYGFGYLKGYVAVKFDFQGNLLDMKDLDLGTEINHLTLESIKSALNENDEFLIMAPFSQTSGDGIFKFDKDLNLISSQPPSTYGIELLPLGNSGYVLPESENGNFTVTDSDLRPIWKKVFVENALAKTQVIRNGNELEIWTIRRFMNNSVLLTIHNMEGNEILSKQLPFSDRVYFDDVFGIEQLPNGAIWLVASGKEYVSDKPYFKDVSIGNFFQIINLSASGEIVNQAVVERLGFRPPDFPGGFPVKFFGLYQGHNGMILSGKWLYSFLVQFNSENSFSPC